MKYEEVVNSIKDENAKTFFETAIRELELHNIKVNFYNRSSIRLTPKEQCQGFFDDESKQLRSIVLKKNVPLWLGIFMHEYCHFKQYIENSSLIYEKVHFDENVIEPYVLMYSYFENNLNYKSDSANDVLTSAFDIIIRTEFDAERRVLEIVKEYKLEHLINLEDYTKNAIFYLINLWLSKITGVWDNGSLDLETRQLLLKDYPENLTEIVLEHSFLSEKALKLKQYYQENKVGETIC